MFGVTRFPKGVVNVSPPANGCPPGLVWHPPQSPRIERYRPRSTRSKLWVPSETAAPVKASERTIARSDRRIMHSLDQGAGVFEVTLLDGVSRPIGEGADRVRRVVAVVLRKHRRAAGDEHIVHVPALAIPVDDTRCRICAHHHATGVMGRLVDV